MGLALHSASPLDASAVSGSGFRGPGKGSDAVRRSLSSTWGTRCHLVWGKKMSRKEKGALRLNNTGGFGGRSGVLREARRGGLAQPVLAALSQPRPACPPGSLLEGAGGGACEGPFELLLSQQESCFTPKAGRVPVPLRRGLCPPRHVLRAAGNGVRNHGSPSCSLCLFLIWDLNDRRLN